MLVITGNGKGKSTAGFGNVTRCVGHGYKAAVVQSVVITGRRAIEELIAMADTVNVFKIPKMPLERVLKPEKVSIGSANYVINNMQFTIRDR